MLENIKNAAAFQQGLFVTAVGLVGVFFILFLFFVVIKLLGKVSK